MVWGTILPHLPVTVRQREGGGEGVKACQDGLGRFFFYVCLFDRGGLKLFGQCPYRANTFQKGASLRAINVKKILNNYKLKERF